MRNYIGWLTDASSIWVFLLLGMEGVRTYKTNPYLVIGTHHVPTWTTPLLMVLVVEALIPGTSFIGHLCGVGTGYLCTYTPFMHLFVDTNDELPSRSRIPQIPCPARVGIAMDRRSPEPPGSAATLRQRGPEDIRTFWRATHKHVEQRHDAG